MRCRKAHWYLSARCDGTLSERQRARLDDHLKSCPVCRRESFYFSEIATLAGRMEPVAVRPDFDLRLRAAISRSATASAASAPWYSLIAQNPWRRAMAVCSVVLIVGLTYGGYRTHMTNKSQAALSVATQTRAQSTLDYFGALVSGQTDPAIPAGWTPIEEFSPGARRLQRLYLKASQGTNDYVLDVVGLDDPNSAKPMPVYILPMERSDQMVRTVSY